MAIRQLINEFVLLFTAIKDGIMYVFLTLPSNFLNIFKPKPKVVASKGPVKTTSVADAVSLGAYGEDQLSFPAQDKDLVGIIS